MKHARLIGFLACAIVAFDCAAKAAGAVPTHIPHDWIWTWWIVTAIWALYALGFATTRDRSTAETEE